MTPESAAIIVIHPKVFIVAILLLQSARSTLDIIPAELFKSVRRHVKLRTKTLCPISFTYCSSLHSFRAVFVRRSRCVILAPYLYLAANPLLPVKIFLSRNDDENDCYADTRTNN
jgi:hypothetical protein